MLTVPLSMTGALPGAEAHRQSINVYSQIGLVTLVGLITKHGILIVEFANQLQEQGRAKLEAVIEAATLRLRPILMTTGAMVLGSVPLALATGRRREPAGDRLGDRGRLRGGGGVLGGEGGGRGGEGRGAIATGGAIRPRSSVTRREPRAACRSSELDRR